MPCVSVLEICVTIWNACAVFVYFIVISFCRRESCYHLQWSCGFRILFYMSFISVLMICVTSWNPSVVLVYFTKCHLYPYLRFVLPFEMLVQFSYSLLMSFLFVDVNHVTICNDRVVFVYFFMCHLSRYSWFVLPVEIPAWLWYTSLNAMCICTWDLCYHLKCLCSFRILY